MDNGFGSSIMTFYEITEGDLSDKTGESPYAEVTDRR